MPAMMRVCSGAGRGGRAAGKHTGGWLGIAVGRHWHCVCAPAGKQPWALHREAGMCDKELHRGKYVCVHYLPCALDTASATTQNPGRFDAKSWPFRHKRGVRHHDTGLSFQLTGNKDNTIL